MNKGTGKFHWGTTTQKKNKLIPNNRSHQQSRFLYFLIPDFPEKKSLNIKNSYRLID
jgi:hypothetical protein